MSDEKSVRDSGDGQPKAKDVSPCVVCGAPTRPGWASGSAQTDLLRDTAIDVVEAWASNEEEAIMRMRISDLEGAILDSGESAAEYVPCPRCNGTSFKDDVRCIACNGAGEVRAQDSAQLLEDEWFLRDQRPESALRMLAARAVAHCPRDLAEVLCRELGIPMPEGFVEKPSALDAWATPCVVCGAPTRPGWASGSAQPAAKYQGFTACPDGTDPDEPADRVFVCSHEYRADAAEAALANERERCGCTWEGMDLPGPEVDDERAVATLNPCLLHQVWADRRATSKVSHQCSVPSCGAPCDPPTCAKHRTGSDLPPACPCQGTAGDPCATCQAWLLLRAEQVSASPQHDAAIVRMVALVEGYQALYAEACEVLEQQDDVPADVLRSITRGESKLQDRVNAHWPGDSGALPATFKYPGPDMERVASNASPACSMCTVEPATHCARCVAAAEVHARRMGQLDQIGRQVEGLGRAIDSGESADLETVGTVYQNGVRDGRREAIASSSGVPSDMGRAVSWLQKWVYSGDDGPNLNTLLAELLADVRRETVEACAAPSSRVDPGETADLELSRRAQSFGYEHRDCNPNGATVMNAIFRLLSDERRETIEACANVASIPVLRDEPHRIVRNIRNLATMSAETIAKLAEKKP